MKTQKERAEQFEIFNASYNRILTKIKKLINSKDSQKLKQMTQILNTFEKEPNIHKKVIDMFGDSIRISPKHVIACKLNNEVKSLNYEIKEGDNVELVDITSKDGMQVYMRGA